MTMAQDEKSLVEEATSNGAGVRSVVHMEMNCER
jgi:hypothetical protein